MILPATRISVNARGLALGILAGAASVFALSWAQTLLVPLLLGIVVSYTLNPRGTWREALRIPRVLGAVIVMAGVIGALAIGTYSLRGQIQTVLAQLPDAATTLSSELARLRMSQIGAMQKMQNAATDVEKATTQATSDPRDPRHHVTHVIVDQPTFRLGSFLWSNSMGALGAMGGAATVGFLVFSLLLSANTLRRKLVRLAGSPLSKRKIAVHVLDDINNSIQKYMLMLVTMSLLVVLLNWIAFRWIGLENAGAWSAAAGLLHVIPYLGPCIAAIATGMAAFMQFKSLAMAVLVAGASLGIATLVGTVVTNWMTGRIARMNPAAVFVSLMFWGWLWGVWGMLLSIPLIVIVKAISQHVEQLNPLAELLGE
jgi:predicted PurR-regulated permease PerM